MFIEQANQRQLLLDSAQDAKFIDADWRKSTPGARKALLSPLNMRDMHESTIAPTQEQVYPSLTQPSANVLRAVTHPLNLMCNERRNHHASASGGQPQAACLPPA